MGLVSLEDVMKRKLTKDSNSHFMLVDGMSKLLSGEIETCQSSEFLIEGVKWKLIVKASAVQGYISLYLNILLDEKSIGCNWTALRNLKFILLSPNGADWCNPAIVTFKPENKLQGKDSFVSHQVLKQAYLVDDKAVFGVEVNYLLRPLLPLPVHTNYEPMRATAERVKLIEVPKKNSRFTWKITQFSSFDSLHHSSYEFTVGPRRWNLLMYPKGLAQNKHLSLFLHASDFVTNGPKIATLCVYKLRLLDQLKRKHHETRHEAWFNPDSQHLESSWGHQTFLPLEELHNASRGFLVNDEIYIGVEFLYYSTTEYITN